jgi:hypothetical protein
METPATVPDTADVDVGVGVPSMSSSAYAYTHPTILPSEFQIGQSNLALAEDSRR